MRWIPLLVVGALLVGCEGIDTGKANKKVDEANNALEDGNDLLKKAGKTLDASLQNNAPEDLKKCSKSAEEAAEKYEEASKLAKEASEMKIRKVFGEYLELKSKSFAKRGEIADTLKKLCKTIADKALPDAERVVRQRQETIDELVEEADELDAKAAKIQKDNPDQFK
jgi:hypothetical protein